MTRKIKLDSIEPVYQVEDNIAESGARSPENLKLKKKKKKVGKGLQAARS
jgi:hypothetical protein